MQKSKGIKVLLTAAIDSRGTFLSGRNDPQQRLNDYKESLRAWVADPSKCEIIFCENTGFDLSELEGVAIAGGASDRVQFISYVEPSQSKALGKGFAEMGIIKFAIEHAKDVTSDTMIFKCTGRYYVENFCRSTAGKSGAELICTLKQNLKFCDSGFFGLTTDIYQNYLIPERRFIDDNVGSYFEHALARATLRAIADGRHWRLFESKPRLRGISGTYNVAITDGITTMLLKDALYRLKKKIYAI